VRLVHIKFTFIGYIVARHRKHRLLIHLIFIECAYHATCHLFDPIQHHPLLLCLAMIIPQIDCGLGQEQNSNLLP
jgi:hypothetical protein